MDIEKCTQTIRTGAELALSLSFRGFVNGPLGHHKSPGIERNARLQGFDVSPPISTTSCRPDTFPKISGVDWLFAQLDNHGQFGITNKEGRRPFPR
jgi:hypothetical protein